MRRTALFAFAAGFLFAAPLALQAQSLEALDTWERQAQRQLFLHRSTLDLDELTHEVGIGSLDDDETGGFTFTVEGPGSFRVLGVCDHDCTDIDLTLHDLDGNEVDVDVEVDDFPWVDTGRIGSGVRRTFEVTVSMFQCSVNPCRYAVAVFQTS